MGKLFRDTEAAKILCVGVQTVRNWRQNGKGPKYLKVGGAVRYSEKDLEEFLNQCRVNPSQEA